MANLMGDVPDLAIFRSFTSLSAESLLHYQAEIHQLELKLRKLQKQDRDAGDHTHRSKYSFNSRRLRQSGINHHSEGGGMKNMKDSPEQWETMLEIRELLEKYYAALAAHRQVVNFNRPNRTHLDSLNDWMSRPTRGNMSLIGSDSEIWSESPLHELISLGPSNQDAGSPTTTRLVTWYHSVIGRFLHREEKGEHVQNSVIYREHAVSRVIRGIKTLVACMLPVVGIVVLYIVESPSTRLGVIAACTAFFSLTMSSFTSASMTDIFTATAAFSAVLVVFVGTN